MMTLMVIWRIVDYEDVQVDLLQEVDSSPLVVGIVDQQNIRNCTQALASVIVTATFPEPVEISYEGADCSENMRLHLVLCQYDLHFVVFSSYF